MQTHVEEQIRESTQRLTCADFIATNRLAHQLSSQRDVMSDTIPSRVDLFAEQEVKQEQSAGGAPALPF
jgi:hypothetical protein